MSGVIFMPGLATGSLVVAAAMLAVIMFVMGMTSGPLGGWLSSLFPVRVRYSGVSLAFTWAASSAARSPRSRRNG